MESCFTAPTSQHADRYAVDMPSDTVLSALDNYIAALSASAQHTHQAEDRDRYKGHLARAAILFHLLHSDDIAEAKK
jgi:hypothetical protein